jgi:DNA-binding NarL/FixJ family response regulator
VRELTAQQISIVALLAVGLTANEIMERLGIESSCYYARLNEAKLRLSCATLHQLLFKVGRDLAREVEEEG